jgi:hypothetical protein
VSETTPLHASDDSDLVLQKADALMRRHRAFVASGTADSPSTPPQEVAQIVEVEAEAEGAEAAAADDEDIPLLTEVVLGQVTQPNALEAQRLELAQALETWLDEALPQAVLKVMDGVTDQLIATLSAQARNELLPRLRKDRN